MLTSWGRALDPARILPEYPRPQFRRREYLMLNGFWEAAVTKTAVIPQEFPHKILVPFSPESELARFSHTLLPDEYLYYRRSVAIPDAWRGRVLLHFGAVDQQADVFLNGEHAASHAGGYLPFCCEIKDAAPGKEITIVVRVRDMTDRSFHSRGKQTLRPGGIWYTPQSGIWQSVWMEPVPEKFIEKLVITPDLDEEVVRITVKSQTAAPCAVIFGGRTYAGRTNEEITIDARDLELWTPDTPILHDFSVQMGRDRVESYFAMRKFSTMRDERGVLRLALNDRILFHSGLLDQGYWPDGLYTAPDDRAFIRDITLAKQMGFNVLRKHIKVEPLRFYYHCDRLGMIVWQDMPCGGGRFDPLIVTAPLFTRIHLKDRHYRLFGRGDAQGRAQYSRELCDMIEHLYNCPCIGMWVPFNEGWGQFDAARTLERVTALDPTRTVDHASGWHDQKCGLFKSEHVYFRRYRFRPDRLDRCVILSEFGGYSHAVPSHSRIAKREFGYKKERSLSRLEAHFVSLYENEILPAREKGLAAAIYTQLSDVEDECNGLVTYDRQVVKIPIKTIRKVNRRLYFPNEGKSKK